MATLEEVAAKRAARKAALKVEADAQKAADLEAIGALEEQHGDSNIVFVEVPYTRGLPVLAAVRCPKPVEIKRYRDVAKTRNDGSPGDRTGAAEQIAAVCRVYPDADAFAKLCEARPGLQAQLGAEAIALAVGKTEAEAKS